MAPIELGGRQADPRSSLDRLPSRLRLGTRRSALARTQSQGVADQLGAALTRARPDRPIEVELVEVTTRGDVTKASLSTLGGTGVFVSALRDALLDGKIDFAVHSLKDLPTAPADGLLLAAVPVRADSRDALIARDGLTISELPLASTVGTGSPRRAAQLRALGLGLEVVDTRGNVDTRLKLVSDGVLDAVVLAQAGLDRLGRADEITQLFDPLLMLPAPGQGALAVECRIQDAALIAALALLDDAESRASVLAERALLARLEAGCAAPVGALAEVVEGQNGVELSLHAVVGSIDGLISIRRSATSTLPGLTSTGREAGLPLAADDAAAAHQLGVSLAEQMLEDGAAELLPEPNAMPASQPTSGTAAMAREGDL
jgi:hydroxymethylbilane synthase